MPNIVADLLATVSVAGVAESQAQLDAFGASFDAAGASAEAASAGIDAVGASAGTAAAGLDETAVAGDAAAMSLDRVAGSGDAAGAALERVGAGGGSAGAGLATAGAGADASAGAVAGAGAASSGATLGFLGLGAAGLLLAKHMFGTSEAFQTYMQDLVSISPALQNSTDLQNKMAQSILDTSTATGFAATDVGRAMYYAVSGTKSLADAQALVAAGSNLGVIGMTNSTDATKLLTGTFNAYGLTVKDLPKLNDEFTASISNGVLRLSDLQSALPRITSLAAQLQIPLATILGGYDALTNRGVTAADAGVQMQGLMQSFLKPNTTFQAEMAKMGYSSGQDMISKLGFAGAINAVMQDAGGNDSLLSKELGNLRPLRGILGLAGSTSGEAAWNTASGDISGSTGEADKALAAQEQATSFHIAVMKAKFNELAIELGNGIRPIVQAVADGLGFLFGALAKIPGPILEIVGAGLALVSAFTFLAAGGALLGELLAGPVGVALEGVVGSALAAVAPFLLLAGAIYLVYEAFQMNLFGIKDQVTNALSEIASVTDGLTTDFQTFTSMGVNPVSAAIFALSDTFQNLGLQDVANWFTGIGDFFVKLSDALTNAIGVFHLFMDEGYSPFFAAMRALTAFFADVGAKGIAGFFADLANGNYGKVLSDLASGLLQVLSAIGRFAVVTIPSVVVNIAEWAAGQIADLGTFLWGYVHSAGVWLISATINIASWLPGAIADLGAFLWTYVHAAGVWLVSTTINIASWTAGQIADLGTFLWGYVHDAGVWLVTVTANVSGWLPGYIADFGTWLWNDLVSTGKAVVHAGVITVDATGATLTSTSKSSTGKGISDGMIDGLKAITDLGSRIGTTISDAISGINWGALITVKSFDVGQTIGGAIHDSIANALPGIVSTISTLDWGQIVAGIARAIMYDAQATPAVMFAASTAIMSGLLGFMVGLIGGPDASAKLGQVATGIVDGIRTGIANAWNGLTSAVSGWVNSLINAFKSALGIASPSTVFNSIGSDIVSGLLNGLTAGWSAISSWATSAVAWFKSTFSDIAGFFGFGASSGGGQAQTGQFAGGGTGKGGGGGGGGGFGGGADQTQGQGQAQGGGISGILQGIQNTLAGGSGGGIVATFAQAGTDAGAKFNTNLYTGLLAAQTTAVNVWNAMLGAVDTFRTGFTARATIVGNDFNTNLYAGLLAAQTSAANVWTAMENAVGVFVGQFKLFATTAGTGFNTNLYVGLLAAQTTAQSVWNQMTTAVGTFYTNFTTIGTLTGNDFDTNLSNGVGRAYRDVTSLVTLLVSAISTTLGALSGIAYNTGYAIGQGLNAGIAVWTSAIAATASGAVTAAITAAKTAAGVASPSTQFMYIGDMMGLGLHTGLDQWSGALANKSAAIVNGMIGSASGASGGVHVGGPVTQNFTFNIKSTDPKQAALEVQKIYTDLAAARQTAGGMM